MKVFVGVLVGISVVLAGCGGGGGGGTNPPVSLSLTGVAATGLAIPSANVSVKCQTGTGSATTTGSGSYSVAISGGVLPCMLEVTNPADGTKIHSVATGSGTSLVANLTPLTELLTSRLLRQDPSAYFAALSAADLASKVTTAGISAAQADLVVALTGTVDTTAISNFISTPLIAATLASPTSGDVHDKLLDSIRAKLNSSQVSQLTALLANGTDASSVKTSVARIVLEASTYTVGGAVTGLASGNSVTLLNNVGSATTVSANGAFAFSKPVVYNGNYAVTVGMQPTGQTCTVGSGSGSSVIANVGNVTIICHNTIYMVTTLAGSGDQGSANGIGAAASFYHPFSVAVDSIGGVYVADMFNNMIRKISPAGAVSTLAGSEARGSADGVGTAASFYSPFGITLDTSGNVYVADYGNSSIRKISPIGVVETLASGFYTPSGVAFDSSGNIYVVSLKGLYITKISPDAKRTTFAAGRYLLSSVSALTVNFYGPSISIDANDNFYVTDTHSIVKISNSGAVSTLAGSGAQGSADGVGAAASFSNTPSDGNYFGFLGVAADSVGNVYVADVGNNLIRKISPSGVVSTLAGSGAKGSADGAGASATFNRPQGIAVDAKGIIYVADTGNNKIRKITPQ